MHLPTDVNIEALDSAQLIQLLGDITQEVWKRHDNNGDVMVLKTGAVRIRRCPDCGNAITVFCVEVNIPDDKIAAVKDQWYEFLKKERLVPPGWMYANVPCKPGKWYTAYCDCWARDKWFDSAEKAADFYMSENHGIDQPVFVKSRDERNCDRFQDGTSALECFKQTELPKPSPGLSSLQWFAKWLFEKCGNKENR